MVTFALAVLLHLHGAVADWKPIYLPRGYSVLSPAPMKSIDPASLGKDVPKNAKYWGSFAFGSSFVVGFCPDVVPLDQDVPVDALLAAWAAEL